jgi:protein-tyrosine phosphatase
VLALRENAHTEGSNKTRATKVHMILEVLFPGENVDVPDPYHGGTMDFERVYDMLDQACTVIAEDLSTLSK